MEEEFKVDISWHTINGHIYEKLVRKKISRLDQLIYLCIREYNRYLIFVAKINANPPQELPKEGWRCTLDGNSITVTLHGPVLEKNHVLLMRHP